MGISLLIAMRDFGEQQKIVVLDELKKHGVKIDACYLTYTKMGVFQEFQKHPDINVILVSEYLEERSPYTPRDLNELDELSEILKVIPILEDKHQGTEYMAALYSSAIYNALFEKDGSYDMVANMISSGRRKKAARMYYKIGATEDIGGLYSEPDSINAGYTHIENGPKDKVAERAEYVLKRVGTQEFREILSRLSEDTVELLRNEPAFRKFFLETKRRETGREKGHRKVSKNREHSNSRSACDVTFNRYRMEYFIMKSVPAVFMFAVGVLLLFK